MEVVEALKTHILDFFF